jgi:uncharacterized SAM-binding protein YcdF (DUF218 family)
VTHEPPLRHPVRRVFGWIVTLVLLSIIVVPAAALANVLYAAHQQDRTVTDTSIVLGAAQFWGKPSPVLEARLSHAAGLYQEQVNPHITTVGGKKSGDKTTEAQAGRAWLINQGIPRSHVTAVPVGHDTLTSLQAAAKLMQAKGWTSATIVTDPVHEARSLAMARALGIDAHGSPTESGDGSAVTLDYVVRETGGLLYFWLVERRQVAQIVAS